MVRSYHYIMQQIKRARTHDWSQNRNRHCARPFCHHEQKSKSTPFVRHRRPELSKSKRIPKKFPPELRSRRTLEDWLRRFGLLPNNWLVSTKTNSMKCFISWIPLNTHVRFNKTQLNTGQNSNYKILSQWYRAGPRHDLAVIALHPTSFLCPSRRWGMGELGELATW